MATQACDSLSATVASSSAETVLDRIAQPRLALAIWQRPVPQALTAPLEELDLAGIDDLQIRLELPFTPGTLAAILVARNYPETAAKLLASDIASLAGRLCRVSGALKMKVRLEIVETDACRKFHADFTALRLITTYLGQGTQWHRAGEPGTTAQLKAGEVAIFKGRHLLEDPSILHRSPPIEGSGEHRLLLVIDQDRDR
ncbi:DUF1826 domain-containing protein [Novosphingobium beihaiensis]|uniref:DUF1826 domain-containing protein n=1 Tax=Novosphingobium beihaiensis TaxID=2930389 RepID=A0ABT0BW17_9SPHN|nr:DUF1826 domain-containing protein [Novosphingobium beihaiensis]MCJ2188834.1 DUF1826 domain-containing protein [Novosphingobium beihaiensis]